MKAIDYSGILRSNLDFRGEEMMMPPTVYAEILNEDAKIAVDAAIREGFIKIVDPKESFREKVREASGKTGDVGLSEADADVIALALEHAAVIVSDDYAVQNVSSSLGLKFESTYHKGIKKTVNWMKKCTGCGKEYEADFEGSCPVCGSEVRRLPRRP